LKAQRMPRRAAALLLACVPPMALLSLTVPAQAETPTSFASAAPSYGNCAPPFVPNCQPPFPWQPTPGTPAAPAPPGTTTTPPSSTVPNPPSTTQTTPEATAPSNPEVQLAEEGAGARGTETVALSPGGYIDDAIPQTLFRLRYDDRFNINRFDRAEYMYGTWREASFHPHAFVNNGSVHGIFFDPEARGPQTLSDDIHDQILSGYLEVALNRRFSAFVDVPIRFVNFGNSLEEPDSRAELRQFPEREVFPQKNDNIGLSDIEAGFKYALIADPNCRYVTFQFRTYIPTGDPGLGLGTGHVSLEPGLLLYRRLTKRLVGQGEFIDWIPISAGPGAGNVLTYGGGLGYDVIQRCDFRLTPVAEVVGWTVLGGTEAFDGTVPAPTITTATGASAVNVGGALVPSDHGFLSASGDTIVNLKLGVRTYFRRSDLYVGYGRALTGSRWYEDIFRAEYRVKF
jgi:hypothetical protein